MSVTISNSTSASSSTLVESFTSSDGTQVAESVLEFSRDRIIPVDPILPFFTLNELDVLCRLNKAFKKCLLPISVPLVFDMHERAVHILSPWKTFPKASVKQLCPLNLNTHLINTISPEVFKPFIMELTNSCRHFSSASLKASFIKEEIFIKVYCALNEKGILMPHKWALRARLQREKNVNNSTMQFICSDLLQKNRSKWLSVALIIAAEIPDANSRNQCHAEIVRGYLAEQEIEKAENLLKDIELSEHTRGDYHIKIAQAYIARGKIDKAADLLKNITTCNYTGDYQEVVYKLAACLNPFKRFLTDSQVYLNKTFLKNKYTAKVYDSLYRKNLIKDFVDQRRLKDALTVIVTMPPSNDSDKDEAILLLARQELNQILEFLKTLSSPCAEDLGSKIKIQCELLGKPTQILNDWLIEKHVSKASGPIPPTVLMDPKLAVTNSPVSGLPVQTKSIASTDPKSDISQLVQQQTLLSSYWNNSLLFRILSILSIGLLPLTVCLYSLCKRQGT